MTSHLPVSRRTTLAALSATAALAALPARGAAPVDPVFRHGVASGDPDATSVVLSTASPAKFPDVVTLATGQEPTHPTLDALKALPLVTHPMDATAAAVKGFIAAHA